MHIQICKFKRFYFHIESIILARKIKFSCDFEVLGFGNGLKGLDLDLGVRVFLDRN